MIKKIAVTGAAGFIGSNLCEGLLERGYQVAGVDNLSMGSLKNLEDCQKAKSFEFIKEDVRNADAINTICADADVIVHLAAYKIPRYGKATDTLLINNEGTKNILEAAKSRQTKVVLASTSDVYGKNPNLPFSEESDLVIGPSTVSRWSYAVSKLFDEHLAFAYQDAYGIPVSVMRFFGGYGPHQNLTWWGGPQSVFIGAILRGQPMEIHGDGSQTRSFTYVSDHVDGIIRIVENERANGEIFNLGSTHEITILDLANLLHKLIRGDSEPLLKFTPYASFTGKPYEDVMRRVPDISKAQNLLGFNWKVSLEEGLTKTIAWQRAEEKL
ncbi:MAG: GDP-mannose 4,6-dehydratase [Chloroflexi bacterium]|nr:GDP-mannose 4,6-dehydratase [Chloroflexota bacterium]